MLLQPHRKSLLNLLLWLSSLLFIGCATGYFQNAESYMRKQHWEKARQLLEDAIRKNPKDGEAHLLLAEVYGELGLYRTMLFTLENVRKISPKYEKPADFLEKNFWIKNLNLGLEHFEQKKYEDAVQRFQTAALIDSSNPIVYQRLGDAYLMTARYYDAKKSYLAVLSRDPENLVVKNNLAEIYFIEKKYQQSIELCTQILASKEDNINALMRRAYSFDALGKFNEAEKDYLKTIELNPTHRLLTDFGLLCFQNGKFKRAIELFTQASELSRNKVLLYRYLGDANRNAGNFIEMAKWYQKLVESNPDDLMGWKNLAIAYEAIGAKEQLAQARSHIDRLISSN